MMKQLNTIQENTLADYSLSLNEFHNVSISEAINRAHDDHDIGDYSLFQSMQEISECLDGADRVYFDEMTRLINSDRFYV